MGMHAPGEQHSEAERSLSNAFGMHTQLYLVPPHGQLKLRSSPFWSGSKHLNLLFHVFFSEVFNLGELLGGRIAIWTSVSLTAAIFDSLLKIFEPGLKATKDEYGRIEVLISGWPNGI